MIMRKFLFGAIFVMAASTGLAPAWPSLPSLRESGTVFVVNTKQSTFKWLGKKVTGQHEGTVDIASGTVIMDKGILAAGQFVMDMTTIANTDITMESMRNKLLGHLRSDDFFSVDKHPKAYLKVKSWTPIRSGKDSEANFTVAGDLNIKGITQPISFPARVDIDGKTLKAVATFPVDRTLYDIKFRSAKFVEDLGDKMIDDNFIVTISLVADAQ